MTHPTGSPDGSGQPVYDRVSRLLHWLVAGLVLALIPLGLVMTRMTGPLGAKFELYQWHKSIGLTIGALMLLRVIWRATHRPPPLGPEAPAWEHALAQLVHLALYALLLLLPVIGWLMVSSSSLPIPTYFYKLVPVPHLASLSELPAAEKAGYESLFKFLHAWLAYALASLVILHVLAALRHHLVLKDGVLARMLPQLARRRTAAAVLVLAGLGAMSSAGPALAGRLWTVDPAASRIAFVANAGGQPVEGALGRYTARIDFDPTAPETASVVVEMEMASLVTGQAQVDQALASPDWLDPATHPLGRYEAAGARATGEGHYELVGTLTLKGVAKPLPLAFTLAIDGTRATAEAEIVLKRSEFGLGAAIPASTVAEEVTVRLQIVAGAAP